MTPQPHHQAALNHSAAEFRLVTFEETKDGALRARLHVFPTSKCPPYIAISYTWGEEPPRRTIYLNRKKARLRENIYQALKAILRLRGRHRQKAHPLETKVPLHELARQAAECEYFWVDSICIDQESLEERIHQVGLMGQIFSNAKLVMAWLGRESENSVEIMQAIRNYQPDTQPVPLAFGNPYQLPRQMEALVDIFGRLKYWSRVWIVQEIILAKEILVSWGDEFVPWDKIMNIGLYRTGMVPFGYGAYEHVAQFTHEHDENWVKLVKEKERRAIFLGDPQKAVYDAGTLKPATLYSLVISFACHECMESRDKIIGLLGLIPNDAAHLADYSMPTEKYFREVCEYTFLTTPINGDNTRKRFQRLLGNILDLSPSEYLVQI